MNVLPDLASVNLPHHSNPAKFQYRIQIIAEIIEDGDTPAGVHNTARPITDTFASTLSTTARQLTEILAVSVKVNPLSPLH